MAMAYHALWVCIVLVGLPWSRCFGTEAIQDIEAYFHASRDRYVKDLEELVGMFIR